MSKPETALPFFALSSAFFLPFENAVRPRAGSKTQVAGRGEAVHVAGIDREAVRACKRMDTMAKLDCSLDETIEELLVDGRNPFVLGRVPFAMTAIEKAPCRRVDAEGMR